MATSDRPETTSSGERSLPAWLPAERTHVVYLVGGVTLLALLARLVLLGDRIAHWDEARVGYWILHYADTGSFAYRRIIHGPFIQHVNSWLFPILGANDFTMRLPVTLVSLLLPLSALLFREHLRKAEMVAMALFLSFNPVMLYYSRFMRSDVLVAAFMFFAVGLLVRFYDTRKARYLYGAAAFVAFGFASKENAVVYVATWVGATALLADVALFRPRNHSSGFAVLADKFDSWRATDGADETPGRSVASLDTDERRLLLLAFTPFAVLGSWLLLKSLLWPLVDAVAGLLASVGLAPGTVGFLLALVAGPSVAAGLVGALASLDFRYRSVVSFVWTTYAVVLALLLFGFLLLFFYAPRGAGMEGLRHPPAPPSEGSVGFWQGFASPGNFASMFDATRSHAVEEFGTWIGQAGESGDDSLVSTYAEYLGSFLQVMATNAAPLTAFALLGTAIERYGSRASRNLVLFMAYAGFVSVLGYPLGTDIFGAWLVVHALVPLSVPAAVGLAKIYDWGREAFVDDDAVSVGIAAVLLLLVGAQVAVVGATGVYMDDQSESNDLVQYAQPADDPRSELQAVAAAARENDGTDVVLYYGESGDSYDDNLAYVERNEGDFDSSRLDLQPLCANWFNSLPLPWYLEKDEASVECERDAADLESRLAEDPPPVVITQDRDTTVPDLALDDAYTGTSYEMRTSGTETTFWVHEDWAEAQR